MGDELTVLIVSGSAGFPNGAGATARTRAYAVGLSAADVEVRVLVVMTLAPGAPEDGNEVVRGEWRGVPFEYMQGTTRPDPSWLRRRALDWRALRRTWAAIRAQARAGGRTAVLIYEPKLRWILPVWLVCRLHGVRLVRELCEFPFVYDGEPGPITAAWRRLYSSIVFPLFDGVLVISTFLEDYVGPRMRPGAWVLRVPILVNVGQFDCAAEATRGLVGYSGALDHEAELAQLMESVAEVALAHTETRARVIGSGTSSELEFVRRQIAERGLEGRVDLPGSVNAEDMAEALCECSALALPRKLGLFSSAGMPTKLGEYLATGRPVVVTATGDIPLYLHDGVDAFIVEPGDHEAFTRALEGALYGASSQAVGAAGRETARREFDPVAHMRRLVEKLGG